MSTSNNGDMVKSVAYVSAHDLVKELHPNHLPDHFKCVNAGEFLQQYCLNIYTIFSSQQAPAASRLMRVIELLTEANGLMDTAKLDHELKYVDRAEVAIASAMIELFDFAVRQQMNIGTTIAEKLSYDRMHRKPPPSPAAPIAPSAPVANYGYAKAPSNEN